MITETALLLGLPCVCVVPLFLLAHGVVLQVHFGWSLLMHLRGVVQSKINGLVKYFESKARVFTVAVLKPVKPVYEQCCNFKNPVIFFSEI